MIINDNKISTSNKDTFYFAEQPFATFAQTIAKDDASAVTVNGKKVVLAGTIYPTNDKDAKGLVLADTDVTEEDAQATLLVFGFVNKNRIPTQPTDEAATALKGIFFMG